MSTKTLRGQIGASTQPEQSVARMTWSRLSLDQVVIQREEVADQMSQMYHTVL